MTGSSYGSSMPRADLSVIIVVSRRLDDVGSVYHAYKEGLRQSVPRTEFIYVMDGPQLGVEDALKALQNQGEPIVLVALTRRFGETACLREGVKRAQASKVLILPPFLQVEPSALGDMISALETADLVVASRDRSGDSTLNKLRAGIYSGIARLAQSRYDDPGCSVRAMHLRVLNELNLLDGHEKFLPLLAEQAGFRVAEVRTPQAALDRRARFHSPGAYLDSILDVASIAFVTRFLQKPFRFFGTIGFVLVMLGLILGVYLVVERLAFHVSLEDRPLMIAAVLLVVLGVQIAAVGLIAEIVIFTRSATLNYRIREIVEHDRLAPSGDRRVIDARSSAALVSKT